MSTSTVCVYSFTEDVTQTKNRSFQLLHYYSSREPPTLEPGNIVLDENNKTWY